jgi:hypothetical protein
MSALTAKYAANADTIRMVSALCMTWMHNADTIPAGRVGSDSRSLRRNGPVPIAALRVKDLRAPYMRGCTAFGAQARQPAVAGGRAWRRTDTGACVRKRVRIRV